LPSTAHGIPTWAARAQPAVNHAMAHMPPGVNFVPAPMRSPHWASCEPRPLPPPPPAPPAGLGNLPQRALVRNQSPRHITRLDWMTQPPRAGCRMEPDGMNLAPSGQLHVVVEHYAWWRAATAAYRAAGTDQRRGTHGPRRQAALTTTARVNPPGCGWLEGARPRAKPRRDPWCHPAAPARLARRCSRVGGASQRGGAG